MQKTLKIIALTLLCGVSFAQQDAQFSQNMFNKLPVNPAYAGTDGAICGTVLLRQQWENFPGAPRTGLIALDAPVFQSTPFHGGAGLTFCQDQLGFDKTTFAKISYSYHRALWAGTVALGFEASMMQKQLNGVWIATDPVAQDASIPDINTGGRKSYDLGLGVYYTNPIGMYFGISSTHLTPSSFKLKAPAANGNPLNVPDDYSFVNAKHVYVMAGCPFPVSRNAEVIPSVLAKTDLTSTQLDLNVRVVWQKRVWGGVSYRLTDAVVAMVGFQNGGFRFGYSFDMTTSAIRNYSNNTHEIMVGYCYQPPIRVKRTMHDNIRNMNFRNGEME
ncbi:MAG: type IX secretion system membrane protein PorP/SprF [Bacteroidetes bacterium]|nr:type IX secretion system membrane protein PorP/SprF [Bacteroidota bacterium]